MLQPTVGWAFPISHVRTVLIAMATEQSDWVILQLRLVPSFQETLAFAKLATETNQQSATFVNAVLIVINILLC